MTVKYQTTNFENATLLPYMLPKALKSQNLYEAFIRSRKKKEVDLEFKTMSLSRTEQRINLLNRLENRFQVFERKLPREGQSYTFRFNFFDADSKTLDCSHRKIRLKSLSSYVFAYNERKSLLTNDKKFVPARFLALAKKKIKLSLCGQQLLLNCKRKKKLSRYLQRLSILNKVGLLDYCRLKKWRFTLVKPTTENKDLPKSEKEIQYFKGIGLRSFLLMKSRLVNAKRKAPAKIKRVEKFTRVKKNREKDGFKPIRL